MFSIVKISKPELIEVCKVRTIEEAYHMLKKWMDHEPESQFEIMECV